MSNREIISTEAMLRGFEYTGDNLFTFQEWKNRGYSVKKGEKAFLQTSIWKRTTKKDKDGKEISKMFMTKASLFTIDQVQLLN
ncbi:ArdC family protein [Clostridium sp.]|uniref:ArdC family protein n=1 Tax=Clostridium sp. TaxID=1506 RepID=UPI001D93E5E9|nr:ArdC family protein [Clostridium sp.]MBS5307742.1 DUF1738 domain-containing protein [Clostridium sp.]